MRSELAIARTSVASAKATALIELSVVASPTYVPSIRTTLTEVSEDIPQTKLREVSRERGATWSLNQICAPSNPYAASPLLVPTYRVSSALPLAAISPGKLWNGFWHGRPGMNAA